jgi:ElaB/YqjD/DUF883 family membrane-anchored ribosome-binding protein
MPRTIHVADQNGATDSEHAAAALSRAATQVEEMTKRSLERAKEASHVVRERVGRAGDMTVGYIREEPMKSLLVAAAVGAVVAGLIGWFTRSRDWHLHR